MHFNIIRPCRIGVLPDVMHHHVPAGCHHGSASGLRFLGDEIGEIMESRQLGVLQGQQLGTNPVQKGLAQGPFGDGSDGEVLVVFHFLQKLML